MSPTRVFVSIAPQQFLLERIGGKFVDVQVMLKAGDSPETFDPSPKQIAALHDAQLYFSIGVNFEDKWLRSFKDRHTGLKVIECCEGVTGRRSGTLDRHVWTSVKNVQRLVLLIKNELTEIDPEHIAEYEHNYRVLAAELEQLDREIHDLLKQRRSNYFFISHAALGHFAEDYGLVQLALEHEGKELGARSLAAMIARAKSEQIQVLLVQKQHPSATALAFANELDVEMIEVDPLHGDYIANLRSITKMIARATQ